MRSRECFRVPAWAIDAPTGDSLTYSNVGEQNRALVTHSLRPWIVRIEKAMSNDTDLCPGSTYVAFDLDGLLRAAPEQRATAYTAGARSGHGLDAPRRGARPRRPATGARDRPDRHRRSHEHDHPPDSPAASRRAPRPTCSPPIERKIRGLIPYGVESRDLGGWREVIEPTAPRGAKLDDLVVTVDHAGVPLGRYPDDAGGRGPRRRPALVRQSCPRAAADVREAVERGDLRAGSWRMRVAKRDEWRGDVRHIHEIAELLDVSVVTRPAYPQAVTEYRSEPPNPGDAQDGSHGRPSPTGRPP